MVITVTGPEVDSIDAFHIQMVLRDALYEFIHARTPPQEYVERRYAEHPQSFRVTKLNEVMGRLELAMDLRNADVYVRNPESAP